MPKNTPDKILLSHLSQFGIGNYTNIQDLLGGIFSYHRENDFSQYKQKIKGFLSDLQEHGFIKYRIRSIKEDNIIIEAAIQRGGIELLEKTESYRTSSENNGNSYVSIIKGNNNQVLNNATSSQINPESKKSYSLKWFLTIISLTITITLGIVSIKKIFDGSKNKINNSDSSKTITVYVPKYLYKWRKHKQAAIPKSEEVSNRKDTLSSISNVVGSKESAPTSSSSLILNPTNTSPIAAEYNGVINPLNLQKDNAIIPVTDWKNPVSGGDFKLPEDKSQIAPFTAQLSSSSYFQNVADGLPYNHFLAQPSLGNSVTFPKVQEEERHATDADIKVITSFVSTKKYKVIINYNKEKPESKTYADDIISKLNIDSTYYNGGMTDMDFYSTSNRISLLLMYSIKSPYEQNKPLYTVLNRFIVYSNTENSIDVYIYPQ